MAEFRFAVRVCLSVHVLFAITHAKFYSCRVMEQLVVIACKLPYIMHKVRKPLLILVSTLYALIESFGGFYFHCHVCTDCYEEFCIFPHTMSNLTLNCLFACNSRPFRFRVFLGTHVYIGVHQTKSDLYQLKVTSDLRAKQCPLLLK